MKSTIEQGRRPFKPPFLMLAILGIHVAAAGFFMMMSGCSTRQVAVEPPPAPVLPPRQDQAILPPVQMPKPTFRPPVAVDRASDSLDSSSTYIVAKGDSLSKIAARAGVSVNELSELNKITNKNQIRIGQKLLLPAHARSVPSAPASSAPKASAKPAASSAPASASGDNHVVQSGDTLGKLAARYGTSVSAFKSVNNLKSDTIRIGQKLVIPKGNASTTASTPAVSAPVASTPVVVEAAAPVIAPEPVAVPVAASVDAAVASDADAPFPYNVKEGDTLDSIAIKFSARKDVIMRLNNMTTETVRSGDKLLIPWQ